MFNRILVMAALVLTAGFILEVERPLLAGKPKAQTGTEQGGPKAVGTLKSITDDEVVITSEGEGDLRFVRNSRTKLMGKIRKGANITVHYRKEKDESVATLISAGGN